MKAFTSTITPRSSLRYVAVCVARNWISLCNRRRRINRGQLRRFCWWEMRTIKIIKRKTPISIKCTRCMKCPPSLRSFWKRGMVKLELCRLTSLNKYPSTLFLLFTCDRSYASILILMCISLVLRQKKETELYNVAIKSKIVLSKTLNSSKSPFSFHSVDSVVESQSRPMFTFYFH